MYNKATADSDLQAIITQATEDMKHEMSEWLILKENNV